MKDKNSVTIGYKTLTFPKWQGYDHDNFLLKTIGGMSDPKLLLDFAMKMYFERAYFHDMLLFIQAKLDNNKFDGEPLGLCLDSSKELFDIMIVPCDNIKICPFCGNRKNRR